MGEHVPPFLCVWCCNFTNSDLTVNSTMTHYPVSLSNMRALYRSYSDLVRRVSQQCSIVLQTTVTSHTEQEKVQRGGHILDTGLEHENRIFTLAQTVPVCDFTSRPWRIQTNGCQAAMLTSSQPLNPQWGGGFAERSGRPWGWNVLDNTDTFPRDVEHPSGC